MRGGVSAPVDSLADRGADAAPLAKKMQLLVVILKVIVLEIRMQRVIG